MPIRKFNLLKFSFCSMLFVSTLTSQGQNNPTNSIHDWYDSKVGKETLDLNNGKILLNYDRVLDNNDRFYFDTYRYGTVLFDGQLYNNILLNYDILNDDLIVKSNGENDKTPIIINKSKVKSFTVNGKNYVNLSYNTISQTDVAKGFYEEVVVNDKVSFYVKYEKYKKQLIKFNTIYDDFKPNTYFVISYKNEFFKITNKKSLITIFPELKKNINDYYSNNSALEKSNKIKFLSDLFKYLNTIIK